MTNAVSVVVTIAHVQTVPEYPMAVQKLTTAVFAVVTTAV